jgi:hypothetical protein
MRRVIETEVFRATARAVLPQLVAVACSLALIVFSASRGGATWVIGVFALLLAYNVFLMLWQPFEVSLATDGMLTFRSLVRRRVVSVEDVRQIRRTTSEGGVWLKFKFTHGSVRMARCKRFDALVTRLREVNPRIK